jgi:hypothetical protein
MSVSRSWNTDHSINVYCLILISEELIERDGTYLLLERRAGKWSQELVERLNWSGGANAPEIRPMIRREINQLNCYQTGLIFLRWISHLRIGSSTGAVGRGEMAERLCGR